MKTLQYIHTSYHIAYVIVLGEKVVFYYGYFLCYINSQFLISKVTLIGISVLVDSNSKTKNFRTYPLNKVWLKKKLIAFDRTNSQIDHFKIP